MLSYGLFWKIKVKRASIFFYILLIFLQVQCGTYLLFDSYEKKAKGDETDLSPMLALLGSGDLPPLNIESVSWIEFPVASLTFSRGGGDSFTVRMANPLGCGSLGSNLSVLLNSDGVLLSLGATEFGGDGCGEDAEGFISSTINVTGTVAGKGRVIAKLASNNMFSNFPGLYAGQIVGVVNVTVSTAQTVSAANSSATASLH
ncbi:hypothetical protein CH365_09235 [Leptospira neocaledonica]|uniref:Uncharacterized protein n=1 Tax=Leptospira neocaledonica TaxID=2023192 RepID=A0A2M9ZXY7_9LEPT|nr:hypothetical protein CH365_09235 [Leptospira neocaledonica]